MNCGCILAECRRNSCDRLNCSTENGRVKFEMWQIYQNRFVPLSVFAKKAPSVSADCGELSDLSTLDQCYQSTVSCIIKLLHASVSPRQGNATQLAFFMINSSTNFSNPKSTLVLPIHHCKVLSADRLSKTMNVI